MDTGGLLDDRFELFRELGEGTTAHTFLALEHGSFGLRRLSALKLLKPAFRRNPARLERLLEAARLLAALDQVFSDAPTNPRAGFGRSKAEPRPTFENKRTPQPEPALGGEVLRSPEPEGDTIRAGKPADRWPTASSQLSTVPDEETVPDEDEKTDVGHKPD